VRVASCLVVAAVAVSGCSEKQEAGNTLPLASSSAPAETTTELPPLGPEDMPMPAEARTQDAAGAEAFVRYYFRLLNQSLTTMDPQFLRLFADISCDVCERIASETATDASQGYSYGGGELTISGDISVTMTDLEEAQTAFVADQAPMTVLDRAGAPVPDLVFQGKKGLPCGTIAAWDEASKSWTLTELTLG
jgi:hypothetical protein